MTLKPWVQYILLAVEILFIVGFLWWLKKFIDLAAADFAERKRAYKYNFEITR